MSRDQLRKLLTDLETEAATILTRHQERIEVVQAALRDAAREGKKSSRHRRVLAGAARLLGEATDLLEDRLREEVQESLQRLDGRESPLEQRRRIKKSVRDRRRSR